MAVFYDVVATGADVRASRGGPRRAPLSYALVMRLSAGTLGKRRGNPAAADCTALLA